MSCRKISGTPFEYSLVAYDQNGNERTDDPDSGGGRFSSKLLKDVVDNLPSDIFIFSHGWKGDLPAAVEQYDRWIKSTAETAGGGWRAGFEPLWIGLHWPSQPWGDEDFGSISFDPVADGGGPTALVSKYLERLGLGEGERPLLELIVDAHMADPIADELPDSVADAYSELARKLGHTGGEGAAAAPDAEGAAFDPRKAFDAGNQAANAADFSGGSGWGGILDPLRQLSFWTMKKRGRTVGESGAHSLLCELMKAAPEARVHLFGHSFGTIVVSSAMGGPKGKGTLPRAVDSVMLAQGAVSLWSFSEKVPTTSDHGYFYPLVKRGLIRGALVTTRSVHDRAVGTFYPLGVKLAFSSPSFDPDDLPVYGGLGTFGAAGAAHAKNLEMLPKNGSYSFSPGGIYNLEASKFIRKGDGASGAHSDIDGPEVAWAFWSAVQI